MAKAPKYIQKKVREFQGTGLFKVPELQKEDSGWRIKPTRQYRWVFHFSTEAKYYRWFVKFNKAMEKLGYHKGTYGDVFSADNKVCLFFGAREVGSRPSRSGMTIKFDYIRAVVSLTKAER